MVGVLATMLAAGCDRMLINTDKSYNPDQEKGIIDAQDAMGRCARCDHWGHIEKDCRKTKPPGVRCSVTPQPGEKMYRSKFKLRHVVTLYKNQEPPILDPEASANYYRRVTGIWHLVQTKKPPDDTNRRERQCQLRHSQSSIINWSDTKSEVPTIHCAFGANEDMDTQQKSLRAIKLLRDVESAVDEICTYINDHTAYYTCKVVPS